MEQHMHSGVVWIPEKAKVVSLSGFDAEDGYGKVRKVRIVNMPGIPIHIEFAGSINMVQVQSSVIVPRPQNLISDALLIAVV